MDYSIQDEVAILHFDDGKANAVSHDFIDAMEEGLTRAEKEAKAVIIRGREGLLSGGFDLNEFKKGPEETRALAGRGVELFIRMYSHPQPLLIASTGHAVAAGAFLLLTADNRIGAAGDFKICLPETAIGMTIPTALQPLCSDRLSPRYLTRAVIQAEAFNPENAAEAGFLDEVVDAEKLDQHTMEIAIKMAALPAKPYKANKLYTRKDALEIMRREIKGFHESGSL
jgi:enoyl-CoA hydratase